MCTYEELESKIKEFPEEVKKHFHGFITDEAAYTDVARKLELSGIILIIDGYQIPISSAAELKRMRDIIEVIQKEHEAA